MSQFVLLCNFHLHFVSLTENSWMDHIHKEFPILFLPDLTNFTFSVNSYNFCSFIG